MSRVGRAAPLTLILALGGCLGGAPAPVRYFRPAEPERADPRAPAAANGGEQAPRASLGLSPVRGASHLEDRIVWRRSPVEFGFYDQELWTELPAAFVDRALTRELFEVRGIQRARRSADFSLEADLLAFEEVLLPRHEVRIELTVSLADADQRSHLDRTFRASNPVSSEDPESMAQAMGAALEDLVGQVADAVEATLP